MMLFTVPTLRDWFAAQAAAGYLAAHAGDETALPVKAEVAKFAYAVADALLAERAKQPAVVPAVTTAD